MLVAAVRLPPAVLAALDERARESGRTRSEMAREVLESVLEQQQSRR